MSVTTLHPDYNNHSKLVTRVRDSVRGQQAIKEGGSKYLPAPFVMTEPQRYTEYKTRAYWIGATGQAKDAMQGMIFRKPAEYEVPSQVEAYFDNIDSCGHSVEQFAKHVTSEQEQAGWVAILVDYQSAPEGLSAEEEQVMGLRPYLTTYTSDNIINWKTDVIGGSTVLTLAVLKESVSKSKDEFKHDTAPQYRVLRLRPKGYSQQVYDEHGEPVTSEVFPKFSGSRAIDHIPLYFACSKDNQPSPDEPLLTALADLNIAHYQVTADHMENLFIHGQLTMGLVTKLDWNTFKAANNGDGKVNVGARSGVFLGEGGNLVSLTAPESSSLRVALIDLQEQMQAVGAKFVKSGGQAETAEAARINSMAEISALDMLVANASDAITKALRDFAEFLGVPTNGIFYDLNTDFYDKSLEPNLGQVIVGLYTSKVISWDDAIYMLRTKGINFEDGKTNEDILKQIASDLLNETNIDEPPQ